MQIIKLGIIEDEPLVQENLSVFFDALPNTHLVYVAASVQEFLTEVPAGAIDILLLDIGLPGISGIDGIRMLKQQFEGVSIIMLTAYEDPDKIFRALHAGADAYLVKRSTLQAIKEAVVTVHNGGSFMSPSIARKVFDFFAPQAARKHNGQAEEALTPRQEQIVEGLVEGLSYKMIADKYTISVETVRDHIKKIYRKLHVNSKAEVIRKRMSGEI